MRQSPTMSLVESIVNVAVVYSLAVIVQILVFPLFGLATTLAENMAMGAIFTMVSIVRSFTLRRVFEALRAGAERKPPSEGDGAVDVGRYQTIR